jgi:alkylation response protein AidB-like acyl-CoA dehydrogenase
VLCDVAIELGRGCGSTAWCAGNWGIHGLMVSMFDTEAQAEVFGDHSCFPIISTGFSPLRGSTRAVDDGAVIGGQWDFASGVHHAEWVVVMAIGEQGPVAHLVPQGELEILDTWHTGGLRGTGSTDVAARELFVPAHRLLAMGAPSEGMSVARELYSSPFFRVPMASVFSAGVVGSLLGMAQGGLEVFVERTMEKVGGLSGVKVGSRADVHNRIGEAAAEIDAGLLVARNMFADIRRVGTEEAIPTVADRVRWRRDAAWAGRAGLNAINLLFEVGGAHVLWLDDQLHQFQRDITAASHHYGMAWSTLFNGYGRVALGLEPEVAMI